MGIDEYKQETKRLTFRDESEEPEEENEEESEDISKEFEWIVGSSLGLFLFQVS